jgi:hypothetical protein
VKIFETNVWKGGLCVTKCVNAYSGESDHTPTVVIGQIRYSQCLVTNITVVCVGTSYKGSKFIAVVNVFPVAAKFSKSQYRC